MEKCIHTAQQTLYIRSKRRNDKTHRSSQSWIAIGTICLDCGHLTLFEITWNRERELTRQRRSRSPRFTERGISLEADCGPHQDETSD